jgi:hypothetical protein
MPEATLGNKDPTSLARLLAGGTGAAASSAVASSAAVKSLRAGAEPLRTASNLAYEDTSEPHDLLELQRREWEQIAPRDLANLKRYYQPPMSKPS